MAEKFIKITEDLYYDIDRMEKDISIQEYLVEHVKWNIIPLLSDYQMLLEESLIDCESPIEQLLSMALESLNVKSIFKFNPFIDVIEIEKQKEIQCGKKKYRVDFFIPVIYKNQENKCFVVECDGHEFHQKTKEQVEKDNIRIRDLQKQGYEVIRFSGTEIWHRPYKCADEILKIILSKCKYIKEENTNGKKEDDRPINLDK